jgi:predicted ester cyclase
MGMPPSGKTYEIEEIHVFRLRDGKVAEHWHQFDQMAMMKQLGAMPGGPAAKPEPVGARS